jgi:adenine-specific DNA-methyltransferase
MKTALPQFEKLSEEYLRKTDLAYRKSLGQYFTPRDIRELLLSQLPNLKQPIILDPACGSGEFLISAGSKYSDSKLFGWEIDAKLVRLSRKQVPTAEIIRTDALKCDVAPHFDFVIGNPPYFEFKPSAEMRARFGDVVSGRANIFSMFIKLGLDLLKPGGYLAYVVPPSMNNGAYFRKLREYIASNANIEYLSVLDSPQHFDRAIQSVMLLVLRKAANNGDYIFSRNGLTIFSTEPDRLHRCFRGKTTLFESGFTVRTGRIVWNQHKDKLTHSPNGAVPLIRPFNITSEGLKLGTISEKHQYIRYPDHDSGPAIVVNRVTGSTGNGRLKAAVVPPGMKFLGENHVNVIFPPDDTVSSSRPFEQHLKQICEAINSDETLEVLHLITGNTQVSRTELERLLPIPKPRQVRNDMSGNR